METVLTGKQRRENKDQKKKKIKNKKKRKRKREIVTKFDIRIAQHRESLRSSHGSQGLVQHICSVEKREAGGGAGRAVMKQAILSSYLPSGK